jgi:ABC transporter transmembrane region
MWTGERQSTKMRIRYLEAALNQDVCYFDTDVRTSDVIYAINADAVIVQDAISEKVCSESPDIGPIFTKAVYHLCFLLSATFPIVPVM